MGSGLSKGQVDAICKQVYRRFPELKGTRPRVKSQGAGARGRFLLLFKSRIRLDDGATMPVTVRAVADERGRVIKMASTR